MRHWRGRVAGLVAGLLLGGWLIATPAAQSYVWGAINGIPFGPGLILSGPILVPDGSAAAPSVANTTYPNSGIYFGSGAVAITVVGAQKATWSGATFALTPSALTAALSNSAFTLAQTWNTTGAPTLVDWTITDTASDAASLAFRIRGGAAANIPIFQATSRTGLFTFGGLANGQATGLKHATTSITCSSGTTCTATNLIPASSMVVGVSVRVTTLITGATSISIGDGTDADRWGAGIAVAAGTTTNVANFTIASPVYYAAATGVVLTAAGSDFTAGVIRITVHYIDMTAATS